MSRPRKAIRPIQKNISLPTDLVAKVEIELWSDLEERVPQGAWQKLITELLNGWLVKRNRESLVQRTLDEGAV